MSGEGEEADIDVAPEGSVCGVLMKREGGQGRREGNWLAGEIE